MVVGSRFKLKYQSHFFKVIAANLRVGGVIPIPLDRGSPVWFEVIMMCISNCRYKPGEEEKCVCLSCV